MQSVLGKRSQSFSDCASSSQDLLTPDTTPNPKRLKTSSTLIDVHPDCNKENVAPLNISPSTTPLRRATTSIISVNDRRSTFTPHFSRRIIQAYAAFYISVSQTFHRIASHHPVDFISPSKSRNTPSHSIQLVDSPPCPSARFAAFHF